MRYIYITLLLVLSIFGFAQSPVLPDPSFNGTGQNIFMLNATQLSYGYDIKQLPDGKILVSGVYKVGSYFQIGIIRFMSNGSTIDPTFGVNGVASVPLGSLSSIGGIQNKIKLDAAGNIFVNGYMRVGSSNRGMICKMSPNGVLDPSFGTSGIAYVDVSGGASNPEQFNDYCFDALGNIYLTGSVRVFSMPPNPFLNDLTVAKLTPNGVLDPSFSGDGKHIYQISSTAWEFGYGIYVKADGKIIIGGYSGAPANILIMQVNPDGTMDNSFGTAGMTTFDIFGINVADEGFAMVVQPDGKIVVGGDGYNTATSSSDACLVRVNPNGTPDINFGINGIATMNLAGSVATDYIKSIYLLPDGKFLVGGTAYINSQYDLALARVNTNGTLDMTFNGTGVIRYDLNNLQVEDQIYGIDVQTDGKILISGQHIPGSGVTARYFSMRLIPDAAVAGFTSSADSVCAGNQINFTSTSLGANLTYQWTFEGGSPATSSLQNPSVTYNSTGIYDVKLVVSNGLTIDSLTQENMITVVTIPNTPGTISGPSQLCNLAIGNYSIAEVPSTLYYTWSVEPSQAGILTMNGTEVTFNASASYLGSCILKVQAVNQCGGSNFSSKTVQINDAPEVYNLSGPGYYCAGTSGQTLTLSGSESNAVYELLLDGVATGNIKTGTGSPLTWNNLTAEGFYTATSSNGCLETMAGQVYNAILSAPVAPSTPAGDDNVCSGEVSNYSTSTTPSGLSTIWSVSPASAGAVVFSGNQATITWSSSFSGNATLTVQSVNDCGTSTASSPLSIIVNALPTPVITGENNACVNVPEFYSAVATEGSTYNWIATGGTITGNGTNSVSIIWNSVGTYDINVTETSQFGCMAQSAVKTVAVDICSNANELVKNAFDLFPNPAKNTFKIRSTNEFNTPVDCIIYDATGRVCMTIKNVTTHNSIEISELSKGIYFVQLLENHNLIYQTRLIKE
jgi:uncharacterized delta-60 repeat protein